jgi:hypothetical protein|tara:strand:- start:385 stop:852 length:468 start_codon:yes stop_codon:yes gene_type:complete
MKTLKSIQKNQVQLNSLLMEKWGYKKLNEGEKPFPDLTGDGKVTQADVLKGRGAIDEEEDLSDVVLGAGTGATLEEAPTDAIKKLKKFVKKWPRRKPMPDKPEDKKPPMKPMPDKPEDKKPPMTPMQEDLETLEEHNCRAVHSGMNHDQWAEKNR